MADLLYVTQSDVADLEHVWIVVVSWVSVIYRSHLVVAIQIVHDGPPRGLYVASSSPVAAEHLEMSLRSVHEIRQIIVYQVAPAVRANADTIAHLATCDPLSTFSRAVATAHIH